MKRTLQSAFAAAALLASSSAWAQNFGEKGQIAISAERLFGFTYDSARVTQNNQDSTASVTHFSVLSSPVTIGGGKVESVFGVATAHRASLATIS